jgi:hypothetical protein
MKKIHLLIMAVLLAFAAVPVFADGCFICGSGSADKCKDYCKYSGSDNWDNRKKCESAGCKVSGTASCPSASNYKVCSAKAETGKKDWVAYYK